MGFFINTWPLVKHDVIVAIQEFFRSKRLLKEANATYLALVPKCDNPSRISDFRPISCCNTINKCIAKIMANRIAPLLSSLIDPSQGAFVKGRKITNNILLAQELLLDYHLLPYLPRVASKIDMQKSHDTLSWEFLRKTLCAFDFPHDMIDLIMSATCSAQFSVNINGELHGYFPSGRGLRQGDPFPLTSSFLLWRFFQEF